MDQSLKICICMANLLGGGAEKVMVTLANYFVENGHHVTLLIGELRGPYVERLSDEIVVEHAQVRHARRLVAPLITLLNRGEFDILFTTQSRINTLAAMASSVASKSQAVHIMREASDPIVYWDNFPYWRAALARFFYRRADGIIAPSESMVPRIARYYSIGGKSIYHINNPIYDDSIVEQAKEKVNDPWFLDKNIPVVLAMGRISPEKDYLTLLTAFQKVRKHRLAHLAILGDTENDAAYFKELQGFISQHQLEKDVRFLGFEQNPYKYLYRSKTFVLSSKMEGSPSALIQALTLGCHIVSTDCPTGPSDILKNGENGALVPIGGVDVMAVEIAKTLDKPNLREQSLTLGDPFTRDRVGEEYIGVFRDVMNTKARH